MQAVHNSRMLEFRAPFGAVKTGGNVSLSIITYASDASGAAPAAYGKTVPNALSSVKAFRTPQGSAYVMCLRQKCPKAQDLSGIIS